MSEQHLMTKLTVTRPAGDLGQKLTILLTGDPTRTVETTFPLLVMLKHSKGVTTRMSAHTPDVAQRPVACLGH